MKRSFIGLAALCLLASPSCVPASGNSAASEKVRPYQPEARELEKVKAEAFEYFEANRMRTAATVVRLSPPEMIQKLGGAEAATRKYTDGKWGQEMSTAGIEMYRQTGDPVAFRNSRDELIFVPYRARASAFAEGGELQSYTLATRSAGSRWSYADGTVVKKPALYRQFPGLTMADVPPVKGEVNPSMLRPASIF